MSVPQASLSSPPNARASRWSSTWWVVALLALVLAFHLLTLRSGYTLYSDGAQYVMHAQSLVEGRSYSDIGYIPNPKIFPHPPSYPPGFPLVMAPFIATFGASMFALKVLMVLIFVALLAALAMLVRDRLSPAYLLTLIALVGFSPVFWELKHEVLSDFSFTLFVYLSLYSYTRAGEETSPGRSVALAIGGGVGAAFSMLTRALGIVLWPCFVLYDLLRHRRIRRPTWVVLGSGGLTYVAVQNLILRAPEGDASMAGESQGHLVQGYGDLIQTHLVERLGDAVARLPNSVFAYAAHASDLFSNGYSEGIRIVVFLLLGLVAIYGFVQCIRQHFSIIEVFAILYAAALLPWGFVWSRYLLPILPLFVFYVCKGTEQLDGIVARRGGPSRAVLMALLVMVGVTYGAAYSALDYGPIERFRPETLDAAEYVREHTPPDAVLISVMDTRAMALLADRGVVLPHMADDAELWDFFEQIGATHLLLPPGGRLRPVLVRLLDHDAERFERVYDNSAYQLYRIR